MRVVWRGNDQLRPFLIPLQRLHLDPHNARRHDTQNIMAIKDSFYRFGQQLPLIALREGKVIVGNGRLTAAREGWNVPVPVDERQTGMVVEKWTHIAALVFDREEDAAPALALIDNRSGELATWDYEVLSGTLKQLITLGWETPMLGWLPPQAQPLLAGDWLPSAGAAQTALLDEPQLGRPIQLTVKDRLAFDKAVKRMREVKKKPEMAEGDVVGALSRFYLKT